MTPQPRPRRSALYMPASNARALAKARQLPADVVIIDLEDAVAPEAKAEARRAAVAAMGEGGFGRREVVVRANGLDTPWGPEDLAAVAAAGPDAILVPKVRGPADVEAYEAAIAAAPERTALWAMIETAPALFALEPIAAAARRTRLAAFVVGLNDLGREIGARQTADRAPFHAVMGLAVAAAHMHSLAILDGVHNDIDDLASLERACRQADDFGFDGKSLIHPSHLDVCNRIFSPDPAEIAWAREVIAAFEAPENAGKGALRVRGRMAERLHREQAVRLVRLAEAIAAAEGSGFLAAPTAAV
ncbi:MAG TPA: CoA ester lyase [Caulobacteraceae bacterium]|nr:CoA ester lyase [Caulobacteraceae bacterium]